MTWAIFRKSLRDSRRSIIGWSIGLALYALLVASMYPSIVAEKDTFEEVLESYPEGLKNFLGGFDSLTEPAGYLQAEMFNYIPLILAIFVILQGLNSITGEEKRQSMDMLAVLPIPRWQIITEKFLATTVGLFMILTTMFLTLVASTQIWTELDISAGNLAAATYGMALPLLAVAGVAYLCSAALPMHRRWGGAIATTFLIANYLIFNLGNVSDALEPLQPFTIFNYYTPLEILEQGWKMVNVLVLAIAIGALYVASVGTFERRDLGT